MCPQILRFRFRFENLADQGKIHLFFTFAFELFVGATLLPYPFFLESLEPDPGNVLNARIGFVSFWQRHWFSQNRLDYAPEPEPEATGTHDQPTQWLFNSEKKPNLFLMWIGLWWQSAGNCMRGSHIEVVFTPHRFPCNSSAEFRMSVWIPILAVFFFFLKSCILSVFVHANKWFGEACFCYIYFFIYLHFVVSQLFLTKSDEFSSRVHNHWHRRNMCSRQIGRFSQGNYSYVCVNVNQQTQWETSRWETFFYHRINTTQKTIFSNTQHKCWQNHTFSRVSLRVQIIQDLWKLPNCGPIYTGRTRNASKWKLLMWMGVFTLSPNNIKGFALEFACSCPVCIGPVGSETRALVSVEVAPAYHISPQP